MADENLFQTDPDEYVRRDIYIEANDFTTRRRASCTLAQVLLQRFEEAIVQCLQMIMTNYMRNGNWQQKDAIIFLLVGLGESASKIVSLSEFCERYIVPELQHMSQDSMIIKADALKYVHKFASQLENNILFTCGKCLTVVKPLVPIHKRYLHLAFAEVQAKIEILMVQMNL